MASDKQDYLRVQEKLKNQPPSYGQITNDMAYQHSSEGVEFLCEFCDLRTPIYYHFLYGKRDKEQLMRAVSAFVGYHAVIIHRSLNGFQGYDTLRYVEVK